MKPHISFRTIKAVTRIICGDVVIGGEIPFSPYRTNNLLHEFFHEDVGLEKPDSVAGTSRQSLTESWLKAMNNTFNLKKLIEASVRPSDYVGSGFNVEKAVFHLNEFLIHDDLQLVKTGKSYTLVSKTGVELKGPETTTSILSNEYVQELAEKCDSKLASGDLEGAITNSRTLLEAVFFELENALVGTRTDFKGDFPRQFKNIAKLLRIDDERPDLDDRFKDVVRGLVQVVNGLAPLRNKLSDGHARVKKPAAHHARVIVNSAKTVALFLVESYNYQVEKGTLTTKKKE